MSGNKPQNEALEPLYNLDRVIHEPTRLMIMAFLYSVVSADFIFTLLQTGLTRGNLSAHMNKLEEAGYLTVTKKFVNKKPLTLLQLTEAGRQAIQAYSDNLQGVLSQINQP